MRVYSNWKIEEGSYKEVDAIEFLDYLRREGRIYTFKEKGVKYLCEIWLVENQEGERNEVRIRKEYDPDLFGDKKTPQMPPHLMDTWANPIVDPPQYVRDYNNTRGFLKRSDYPNKELEAKE